MTAGTSLQVAAGHQLAVRVTPTAEAAAPLVREARRRGESVRNLAAQSRL